jgi:hypothetical protein
MQQLDDTLDTVEVLIRDLPISELNKRALSGRICDLWALVESIVEMELSVDNAR